ncbi:hypothetical protein [Mucilaginibacter panaciglaebae]|uniref:Uncharacterized protein n=1 Tax=Mucilaginibacter panaciglaebae TaxID=502331 RepID=A0ABP7X4K4_9SPHI
MLVTALEILLLFGAVVVPLVPRKSKSNAKIKSQRPAPPDLSNFVINEDGKLEEINNPHDTSLFQ